MYDIYVYIGSMDVALVDQAVVFVSVMHCLVKKNDKGSDQSIYFHLFVYEPAIPNFQDDMNQSFHHSSKTNFTFVSAKVVVFVST